MSFVLYGLTSCDTCRKARRWLDAHGVAYRYHDVRTDGLDASILAGLAQRVGWEPLVNRRSTTWRTLADGDRDNLDEARALALMKRNPTLMKRPVLVRGKRALVGFNADTWREFAQ